MMNVATMIKKYDLKELGTSDWDDSMEEFNSKLQKLEGSEDIAFPIKSAWLTEQILQGCNVYYHQINEYYIIIDANNKEHLLYIEFEHDYCCLLPMPKTYRDIRKMARESIKPMLELFVEEQGGYYIMDNTNAQHIKVDGKCYVGVEDQRRSIELNIKQQKQEEVKKVMDECPTLPEFLDKMGIKTEL